MKLSIKFANGTEKVVDLGPDGLKLAAQPGATYHVIDEHTMKTPATASVKRVAGDLQIDSGESDAGSVQITGFFDDCTPSDRCWATFDAPVDTSAGMPAGAAAGSGTPPGGVVTITQDGSSMSSLQGGHVGGMADGQTLSFGDASHDAGLATWGTFGGMFAGLAGGLSAASGGTVAVVAAPAGAVALGSTDTAHPLVIKGTIAAGAILTGTVEVSAYDQNGHLLGKGLVNSDKGTYEIDIADRGGYTGPVLLVARDANSTGGNYIDEATGKLTDLGLSLGAVGVATSPTDLMVINITPITQIATREMGIDVNAADATFVPPSDTAMIAAVNASVGKFFGVADILGSVVTINDTDFRTSSADAQAYGVALARLSQIDSTTGSSGATINWLVQQLAVSGSDMTSTDASLDTLDTSLTVARLADLAAAVARGDVTAIDHVNLTNITMVELVFAMPVNAQVGDLVHVTLAGTAGSVAATVYVVTAADLQNGYASVPVSPLQLAQAGTGTITPTAIVTDAAGGNASPVIGAQSFLSDVTPPDPVLTVAGVHGNVVTAADTTVAIHVAYDDVQPGDVVQLWLDGAALGATHTVTAAEAAAGGLDLSVNRAALGADGAKLVAATVLDIGGNTGVAAQITLALDTSVPAPTLALKAGEDGKLTAGETGVDFEVRYAGMAVGDTVQLQVAGDPAGVAHVVTAAEVASGVISVSLPAAALGDPGTKDVAVVVTDTAGNAGTGPDLPIVVDTAGSITPVVTPPVVAPSPSINVLAGESNHLGLGNTDVHLQVSFAGMSVGDTVQLQLGGTALGAPHVVTADDLFAGSVTFDVTRASLGADGLKLVTAVATDADGHAGTSAPFPLSVDTQVSSPTLSLGAGESTQIGAAQPAVHVTVNDGSWSVGDVIILRADGALIAPAYTVTAADVASGAVTFAIDRASLGADGTHVIVASVVTGSGNTGNSPALPLTLDSIAPSAVTLAVAPGENALLNAAETDVHLQVGYVGMAAGDVVALNLDGSALGTPHLVTAAEAAAGTITLDVSKASLGADGVKNVSATVTDAAGNAGASGVLPLTVDTASPTSVLLAVAAGENNVLNASETDVHLNLGYAGMAAGDLVTLNLGNATLGTPYVVTAADVAAGTIVLDVTKASLGADGVKNVTATVVDAAGNTGTSPVLPLTLDTVAPSSVSLAVAAGEDSYLNAGETDVHLNLGYAGMAAGDVVTLNLGGSTLGTPYVVTAADVAAGTIVLDVTKASLGADGLKNVTATVTDAAGNAGTSPVLPLTVDTTAPASVALAVAAGEDAYLNASETDVHLNLGYAGMAVGDVVTLNLGSATLGTPYVVTAADVAAGTIVLDVTKASLGADGVKSVTATVTDLAGNSGTSPVLPLTVDTVAPSAVGVAVAAGETAHLGLGDTDVHLVVTYGGMAVGDTVQLQLGGAALGASHVVTAADLYAGGVTFDVTRASLGADGVKNVTALATDAAGNAGASPVLPLTVDTLVSSPTLTLGAGETDHLGLATADVHITVAAGTLAAGDVVQLQLAGASLAPAYVVTAADVAAGGVTFDVSRASLGADGIKNITATVTDASHNVGTSPVLPLTVDTVAPSSVSLAIAAGEDAYLNASETDVHLDVGYAGMAAGDVVALSLGGSALGTPHVVTAAEAAAGTIVLDVLKSDLGADGIKNITVTATDAAGNAGTSPVLPLTVDTQAPANIGLAVAAGENPVMNASEADVHLDVAYAGMAAGDVVALNLAGSPLGASHVVTAAEAAAGVVVLDVTRASLGADGIKNVVASVTDLAGNTGNSAALPLTVDTAGPSSVSLAVAAGENSVLNASETDVHLDLVYAGMAAGDVVLLNLGNATLGTPYTVTAADVANGQVVLDVTRASLGADGLKSVTATVTDAAGNAGTSPVLPLTVDTAAPSSISFAVAPGEHALLGANDTDVHLDLGYAGMAAGDVVTLQLGNGVLGTPYVVTAADVANGQVVFDVTAASLGADGVKNLTATIVDAAGNAGTSAVLPLTLDTTAPAAVTLAVAPGENAYLNAAETDVHVNVGYAGMAAGDVVTLNLGNATLGTPYTVTAADVANGAITLDVTKASLGADGVKNIVASVADLAGNTGASPALALTVDTAAPAPTLAIQPGEDAHVGLGETDVHLQVSYAGMAVGDSVLLDLGNGNTTAAHVVTAADLHAGNVTFDVARSSLGADGTKNVTAIATDPAGNTGSSAPLTLQVDSQVAAPSLTLGTGESPVLGLAANDVHVTVGYANVTAGDMIQLTLDGVAFGLPYVVTAADAANGNVTFDVTRASLGSDGTHVLVADVLNSALNLGVSSPLPLTVDTVAPSVVTLAVAPGENAVLNASETDVHLTVGYAGMAAGDVIAMNLGGSTLGTPYTVTAADVAAGFATVDVTKASLGADGTKNVVATVTDAAGNSGNSPALALTVDTVAPSSVTLAVAAGEDAYLNASETDVHLNVGYAGMVAGDVVSLNFGGVSHVVTAAEAAAGTVVLDLGKAALGADGVKNVVATVADAAGNTGASTALPLTVDTAAPMPSLAPAAGENTIVNASESHLDVVVTDGSLQVGEVIQLTLDGQALGAAHTVTSADVAAGSIGFTIAKGDLGADGTHQLVAVATDLAGNVGASSAMNVVLDTSLPQVAFSNGNGSVMTGAGSGALGAGHAGVALVDGGSTVTDGGTVAIGSVAVSLAGFVDGANERLTIGGQTLNADGSNAPATVGAAGLNWAVAFTNNAYTFTAIGSPATAAQTAALMQASYNDTAPTITDGQRVLTYVLTDADGNPGNAVSASVLVSTTPPSIVPSITALGADTGIAGDFDTTVAAQTIYGSFTGQPQQGDTIQVSTDGTTWTAATVYASGAWYANGITLLSGTHNLFVRAIDAQGNAQTPSTHGYTLDAAVITTTAHIDQVTDNLSVNGSVTGALASGVSTDDSAPTLGGSLTATLASGQVVAIYDTVNGTTTRLGEATVNGTAWTFAGTLPAGQNSLTAVVEKPASGAASAASNAFVVDEQTIAFGVYDHVGSVQGLLMQGGITDDAHATVSGTIGASPLGTGEVVAVYDGATRLGNATVNGTAFNFTPGTALADGSHTLVAMIEDDSTGTATNGRVVGTPLQFTVDTTNLAPVQTVTIAGASEATATNGSVTGGFASGTSTDGTTPTLTGTLSATLHANQDLAIFDTSGGVTTKLGTATVNGTSWTYTTSALGIGSHSLTAVVENTATGLQGTASSAFTVNEQSVALTSLTDDVGVNVGFILNNGITDDARPTVAGTLGTSLGSGEAVVIYDGSTRLGDATVTGTSWSFTPTTMLLDGAHSLRAMVEDDSTGTAANGRVVSNTMNFITVTSTQVPTETVANITATESTATNGSVSGTFASGTSTDGTTPTFSGTTSTALGLGEAVAVWDTVGGVSTRLGFATSNGTSWSFTSPALAVGTHSITVRVENAVFGSDGAFSAPFTVIEQSLAVTGLTDHVGAVQGLVAAGGVTDDAQATFAGTLGTAALGTGEVVAVYDGTVKLGNATVNGTAWSFTPGSALADGAHSLQAMIEDGTTGTAATGRVVSAAQSFTLNTSNVVPTQTATIASVTESTTTNGSVSGAFASGTSTDGTTPTLNGSISAALGTGQVLAIYDGATRLGTATVNGTSWTYTTPALGLGANNLTAVVENPATGAHGTASAVFDVIEQSLTIDSLLGITGAANVLVGGIATVVLPTAPQLSGTLGSATLGANEVVAVYDGATKLGNAVLNGNAWGFSTSNAGLIAGYHSVTVMIQDAGTVDSTAGRVVTSAASFTVNASLLVPSETPQITYGIESASINGSKIGGFASSESIDSQTPTLGGTVNATLGTNEVLAVYDGTTRLGNATVVGQSWSYATPTLAYGVHNITTQVENVNTGSHGTASNTYVVKVQSLSAITVTDDVGAIQGVVANGGVTDDNRPTYSGTLGSAQALDLSLEGLAIYDTYNGVTTRLGYATVSGASWSFTPSVLNLLLGEADGTHSIQAVIEPIVVGSTAQERVVSAASTFTVDTSTTPTQLVGITSVTDGQGTGGSRTGSFGTLSTVDDTTPVFTGTLSASLTGTQKVAVYDLVGTTTTKLGYATVSATNPLQWTFEPTTALVAGTHTLTADVENTASGAQGAMSLGFSVIERPLTLNVIDDQGALQGNVLTFGNGNITDDTTLALNGSTGTALNLGEQVKVFDNGVALGFATVSGTNWSYTAANLSAGDHALTVQVAPAIGAAIIGTGVTVHVQASDVLTLTSDPSWSTTALAAKFTLPGTGTTLDLTKVSGAAQPHIDVIDTGATNGTVKLALADVLTGNVNAFTNANGWSGITFAGSHQLVVAGSSGTVAMADGTWTNVGTATHAGSTYNVYEDSTHLAQLLVDSHLTRTGPIGG